VRRLEAGRRGRVGRGVAGLGGLTPNAERHTRRGRDREPCIDSPAPMETKLSVENRTPGLHRHEAKQGQK